METKDKQTEKYRASQINYMVGLHKHLFTKARRINSVKTQQYNYFTDQVYVSTKHGHDKTGTRKKRQIYTEFHYKQIVLFCFDWAFSAPLII